MVEHVINVNEVLWHPADVSRKVRKRTFWHVSPAKTNRPAHSLHFPVEEILRPWLSKIPQVKILIRLRECVGWSECSLAAYVQMHGYWRHVLLILLFFFFQKFSVPWLSMLKAPCLWACLTAHVCSNWTSYTLLTNIPTFMKEVLKFDIKAVSFSFLNYCIEQVNIFLRGMDKLDVDLIVSVPDFT